MICHDGQCTNNQSNLGTLSFSFRMSQGCSEQPLEERNAAAGFLQPTTTIHHASSRMSAISTSINRPIYLRPIVDTRQSVPAAREIRRCAYQPLTTGLASAISALDQLIASSTVANPHNPAWPEARRRYLVGRVGRCWVGIVQTFR
jgi:hypothetical protein